MTALLGRLRRAARDDRGLMVTEAAIVFPMLVLFLFASYTYYDAYRTRTMVTKASYVVGDLMSRETTIPTAADLAGYRDVVAFLTGTPAGDTQVRITEIAQADVGGSAQPIVLWSDATGDLPDLDTDALSPIAARIPPLSGNERMTLFEAFTTYTPPFAIGIETFTMRAFVPTRRRFWRPTAP